MKCHVCRGAPSKLWRCPATLDIYCGNACRSVHWDFIAGRGKRALEPDVEPASRLDPRLAEILRIVATNPAAMELLVRQMSPVDVLHYALVSRDFNRIFVGSRYFWFILIRTHAPDDVLSINGYNFNVDYKEAARRMFRKTLEFVYDTHQDVILALESAVVTSANENPGRLVWRSPRLSYFDILASGGMDATFRNHMISSVVDRNDEEEEGRPFWNERYTIRITYNGQIVFQHTDHQGDTLVNDMFFERYVVASHMFGLEHFANALKDGMQASFYVKLYYDPDPDSSDSDGE